MCELDLECSIQKWYTSIEICTENDNCIEIEDTDSIGDLSGFNRNQDTLNVSNQLSEYRACTSLSPTSNGDKAACKANWK